MIYLDNNATTKIAPEVFESMRPFLTENYGNPSASYTLARNSKNAIKEARKSTAKLLGAEFPSEIVFTSGGTESDNWAILGSLETIRDKTHLVATNVEHEAVRKVFEKLEANGYEVTWLEVNDDGTLDLDEVENFVREDTALVSIMMANNETGVVFPIEKIAEIVKKSSNAIFHVDGVNAAGKIPINLKNTKIDLFSISGHKFHAPKGVGALYIRDGVNISSNSIGGEQENNLRAGTEAVHQIVGLGKAAKIVGNFSKMEEIFSLREKLETGILSKTPNTVLNGNKKLRLPNTSNISFLGLNGETIMAKLNDLGVFVSTESACNEESKIISPVLKAMNTPYSQAMGAIRFSLGRYNTEHEVDFVLEKLPEITKELRLISG